MAITQDTDSVTVMVLRHAGGLLTVYANLGDVQVQKGAEVAQGAQIGTLGPGTPPFLHFEVRNGQEALDPEIYLR